MPTGISWTDGVQQFEDLESTEMCTAMVEAALFIARHEESQENGVRPERVEIFEA